MIHWMQNNCSGWPAQHDNNAAIGLSFFICDHMRSGEKLDPVYSLQFIITQKSYRTC